MLVTNVNTCDWCLACQKYRYPLGDAKFQLIQEIPRSDRIHFVAIKNTTVTMTEDNSSLTTYKHDPLKSTPPEIRLLTLLAGTQEETIHCTIDNQELASANYQALSYEWEDIGDTTSTITVNGLPFPNPLQRNLEYALQEIRHEETDLMLWTDALCINQDDAEEKGAQVAMMGDIFASATTVITWLGLARDDSTSPWTFSPLGRTRSYRSEVAVSVTPKSTPSILCGVVATGKRVWIIQEIHVARCYELRCGSKVLQGRVLERMARVSILIAPSSRIISHSHRKPLAARQHIILRRMRMPSYGARPQYWTQGLEEWTVRCVDGDFTATDPRDYVYAFLGICRDDALHIVPDYRASVRENLLKTAFVLARIGTTEEGSLLNLAGVYAEKMGLMYDEYLREEIWRIAAEEFLDNEFGR